jgi:hypothetical protein
LDSISGDNAVDAEGFSRFANGASAAAARMIEETRRTYTRPNIEEMQVSLLITLFPVCFTIDNSSIAYPYEEPYWQFIRAIDMQKLTPDVLDILSQKEVHFHDGCVLVEVRDCRTSSSSSYRVLLKPGYDVVVRDAASNAQVTKDSDLLEIEKRMLLHQSRPLCLVPDPAVFLLSSMLNFCERKMLPPKAIKPLPVVAKAASPLYNFLLGRNGGRRPVAGFSGLGLPVYGVPPAAEPVVQPFILPNSSDAINARRGSVVLQALHNREIRFTRPPKHFFVSLRVAQTKTSPTYVGILQFGTNGADSGQKIVITLGGAKRATLYLEGLFLVFQREGFVKSVQSPQPPPPLTPKKVETLPDSNVPVDATLRRAPPPTQPTVAIVSEPSSQRKRKNN